VLGTVRRPVETLDCGNAVGSEDDGRNTARSALTAHTEYVIGDEVEVEMPDGFKVGRIVTVLPNYAWSGETKYSIHGRGFVTIASARVMRKVAVPNVQIESTPLAAVGSNAGLGSDAGKGE
jgi:hypothetical protein